MDKIYECAENFIKLEGIKYHFVFVRNRKSYDIVLDFTASDFRHAAGLHYLTDIAIENNPVKIIETILRDDPLTITDEKLNESNKYRVISPTSGSIQDRISDMRFLEKCLDTSDFMRIYQVQPFGSQIHADFFIESYCQEIKANVYCFIRKREESENYVVVSFFRKRTPFNGISTYWMLKEKMEGTETKVLYRNSTYK